MRGQEGVRPQGMRASRRRYRVALRQSPADSRAAPWAARKASRTRSEPFHSASARHRHSTSAPVRRRPAMRGSTNADRPSAGGVSVTSTRKGTRNRRAASHRAASRSLTPPPTMAWTASHSTRRAAVSRSTSRTRSGGRRRAPGRRRQTSAGAASAEIARHQTTRKPKLLSTGFSPRAGHAPAAPAGHSHLPPGRPVSHGDEVQAAGPQPSGRTASWSRTTRRLSGFTAGTAGPTPLTSAGRRTSPSSTARGPSREAGRALRARRRSEPGTPDPGSTLPSGPRWSRRGR